MGMKTIGLWYIFCLISLTLWANFRKHAGIEYLLDFVRRLLSRLRCFFPQVLEYTQRMNNVKHLFPQSKLSPGHRVSGSHSNLGDLSAFFCFTFLGRVQWKWAVCPCSSHSLWTHHSPRTQRHWHSQSLSVLRRSCFFLCGKEGNPPFLSVSPFRGHASAQWRAPGGLLESHVDKCLQMHFIFISTIKPGAKHRALR